MQQHEPLRPPRPACFGTRLLGTSPDSGNLAARSIGGLCSRALRFPGDRSLEELVLASALGQTLPVRVVKVQQPSGVFTVRVPRAGVLRAVEGRHDAEGVPRITDVTITMPSGSRVRPLPDGTST
jgi:hypothetical protein